MTWWTWVIVGMLLLGIELFAPLGFFLFLIGVSCLLTGLLVLSGIIPSLSAQLTVGGIIGILLLLTARKPLSKILGALGKGSGSNIEAQRAKIMDTIAPSEFGRAELGGASWTVRNESKEILHKGCVYVVARVEGLTLVVTDSKKIA